MTPETFPAPPYPWQQRAWHWLLGAYAGGTLSHAYLLEGPEGLGKLDFARRLAGTILCDEEPASSPCGACRACIQLAAGSHPDYRECAPEEGRSAILVDQVRALSAELALSSGYGGARLAILHPADALNANAANSLLKTLEEPVPGTVLLLVSARPAMLPATVRSRCQRVGFTAPGRDEALAWIGERAGGPEAELALAFTGNAPLRALDLCTQGIGELHESLSREMGELLAGRRDPVPLAEEWSTRDLALVLTWLAGWTGDLLRRRVPGAGRGAGLCRLDEASLAEVDAGRLFAYLDMVYEALVALRTPRNRQQLAETLLLPWAGPGRKPRVYAPGLARGTG
ncbi:MAG TPA: DNA polymerase III subunit delta' [Gammaproteobacteria bacterium]|nr:DNA polymerase III subunit delta' [Gammaproteobacteria bacterium]